jgi:hypothetical protein
VRLLPYLHPLWQLAALALAVWTFSLGLRMRALRRRARGVGDFRLAANARKQRRESLRRRHVRSGLVFLAAIAAGYAGGPLILGLARDEAVFESAHAFFATLTLGVVTAGGLLGYRLWRGRGAPRDRDLHAYCMGLGIFLGIVAAMLGLGLLP